MQSSANSINPEFNWKWYKNSNETIHPSFFCFLTASPVQGRGVGWRLSQHDSLKMQTVWGFFFQHRKIDAAICVATKWTKNKTKKSKRCRESWMVVIFGVLAWQWKSLLRALETENHYQTALLVGTFFFFFTQNIFIKIYIQFTTKKKGNINTGCIEDRAELLIGKES